MRPETFRVHSIEKAKRVEYTLITEYGFCDDGKVAVNPADAMTFGVKCKLDDTKRRWWSKAIDAQQYISRTGTLFVRLMLDQNDTVVFICLENRTHIGSNHELLVDTRRLLAQLKDFAKSVNNRCDDDSHER